MIIVRARCVGCGLEKDVPDNKGRDQPMCLLCGAPTVPISVAMKKTTKPRPSLIKNKRQQ